MKRLALCAALLAAALPAHAKPDRCKEVLDRLARQLVDASCFVSTDLTTANGATTPANNSIPGLAPGAFTPQTDRNVIAPVPAPVPVPAPAPTCQRPAPTCSHPSQSKPQSHQNRPYRALTTWMPLD